MSSEEVQHLNGLCGLCHVLREDWLRSRSRTHATADQDRTQQGGGSQGDGRGPLPPAELRDTLLDGYYKVLELKPGASLKEVKAAYRRLARDYHPDRVADRAKGFQDYASERFKEIKAARDAIVAHLESE